MNKLFTKLAKLTLGLAMACGVGVASNSEAVPVHADTTGSLEITISNFTEITTSYTSTFTHSYTVQTSTVQVEAYGVYKNNSGIQMNKGKGTYIKNKQAIPGYITSIECKWTATGKNSPTLYVAKDAVASTSSTSLGKGSSSTTSQTYTVTNPSTSLYNYFYFDGTTVTGACYMSSFKINYTVPATKTLSSIALSGTYPTSFTIGDSFDHTGMTVTATYSNSSTANVTSSATFSGYNMSTAGSQTVTVSYAEGSVTKTATYTITVTAPTTPYIDPAKNSTSGYTGQNETISFSYGNLTGSLSITSSNTSVVTVGSPSYSAGEGTVQFNFVGAGSTTVKFYDGSTELSSVSVSVTASSVTITGLPSVKEIGIGSTLDLGSLITVTATGSMGNSVVWSSDNTSKATVDANGVVSGVAVGSANITVKSVSQPSVSMTCAVTVKEITEFVLFNGEIAEGDYVIYSDGVALKNSIASNRAEYTSVSPSNDKIIDPDNSIVWSIQKSGESWLVVSKDDGKYLAGNGTKNQIGLFDDTSADRTWSINGPTDGAYSLVSNRNNSASVNDTLRKNGTYGFACYGSSTGTGISLYKAPSNELDHVTTSGQTTSFISGNTFSYGGTLTAYYTIDNPASKTPSGYKLDSESGSDITTSTVLTKSAHDGHEIYVLYTENNITKSAHYTISVNYAAVTSIVIDSHSAEIGLNETFDYTQVGVTVNSQYSDPGYEWIVSANTVSDDYVFDGSGLLSGDTEGTITLRCRSTADNSKYDELVVTVTGDPTASFTEDSVSGYVGKGTSVAFTYGNIDDTSKISVSSSSAAVSVGAITAANEDGSVAITFVSAGSATLTIHYDGGSALDSITVTVSADFVVALNWTASNINVYSGSVLPVAIEDTWMVNYEMASGDADYITYSDGDYTVKLGGSTISLPHTWVAEDDGKTLCVEYMGFESSSVSASVAQTLRPIMAAVPGESAESNLTFTAAASGAGTADDGKTWTVTSDGSESNFDDDKGIHYGTSKAAVQYIKLTSSDFTEGTITQVVVNASTASGVSATAGVKVNGAQFGGDPQSLSSTASEYTFTGSVSAGEIEVEITKPSSATKAIYCKSVVVTYLTASGEKVNIANVAGHEAAQKAVVKYAKAFNEALGATDNCTTGLAAAWSEATKAWNTFTSEAAALGSAEEAYAKNLIKYATAQYTEGTDENYEYCLERAMATYERCVSAHGQTKFMDAVRPVGSNLNVHPLMNLGENSSSIALIVIISMVSLTAIGGYFFLRKRKENQ